ncbi:MAG TPA: anti-sigma regulatory factor [Cryptosporangiaceae bacterium]|nr:anti-sigma regulatory factor [Cryptosporangiaceae bacterium]
MTVADGASTGAGEVTAPSDPPDVEDIELTLPAIGTHLPLVRALAADLAARLDFDLDQVSDLRMAVDEACAELVALAAVPSRLTCVFRVQGGALWITASAVTRAGERPARDTFGWRVLTALVDDVQTWSDTDRTVYLQLCKRHSGADA